MRNNGVIASHVQTRVDLDTFFLNKRKEFDRQARRAKRLYWYNVQSDLLDSVNSNQAEFWKSICKVGISINKNIPMEVVLEDNQADVIEAFNSTSRYLDDLLNIDNPYFEGMVNQIYPPELQLNKANISDTEAPLLDLHLSDANGFVSSKIYE